MKVAVTIGSDQAGDSAFVVWRGFEESIRKAAAFGYDGVELAMRSANDVEACDLKRWLSESGMEVSCITTGRMFAEDHLYFTHPDPEIRKRAKDSYKSLIDMASEYCNLINIGRVRGEKGKEQSEEEADRLFLDAYREICSYAEKKGVQVLIEPVNRYEMNLINSLDQGAEFLSRAGCPNGGLHADVFHMNIEDDRIGESLIRNGNWIKYVHIADSNRLAPGSGHLDFNEIFTALKRADYDGWISMEMLPGNDPDEEVKKALKYISPWVSRNDCEEEKMEQLSRKFRKELIQLLHSKGTGHPGGSLSCVELLTTLYYKFLRVDPKCPDREGRDRLILSKGHAAPILYCILAEKGFFPVEELETFRQAGSRLQGHPCSHKTPGIECSSGPLGLGLGAGLGMALAEKLKKSDARIFVVMGDGEIQEGAVWEAASAAVKYRLDHLTAVLDFNGVQLDGTLEEILPPGDLVKRWEAVGWNVISCDGHSIPEIMKSVELAKQCRQKPSIIIAKTVKGRGVSFMEGRHQWHGKVINDEDFKRAMQELDMERGEQSAGE